MSDNQLYEQYLSGVPMNEGKLTDIIDELLGSNTSELLSTKKTALEMIKQAKKDKNKVLERMLLRVLDKIDLFLKKKAS